jgi:membrane protease subunit HflK
MAKVRETFNRWATGLGQGAASLASAMGRMRQRLPSRHVVVPAAVLIWVLSGFYIIDPGQRGAVQRFGKLDRVSEPGLHYHLPRPIERVRACAVEKIQRYEIGTRSLKAKPEATGEALFLTADESLISAELVVQVRVSSVVDYVCNLEMPEKAVQDAALAALSTVMGRTRFDSALTEEQQPGLEEQIGAMLQSLLDDYKSGIQVVAAKLKSVHPPGEVLEAFAQVTQAREQQRQSEAEALKYENEILPQAKGEAVSIIQNAEAFKLQRISQAQGDADQFVAQLNAYRQAREVTRKRLYLEAAEQIVGQASKVVVASEAQMVWPPMALEPFVRPADSKPAPGQEHK